MILNATNWESPLFLGSYSVLCRSNSQISRESIGFIETFEAIVGEVVIFGFVCAERP